MPELNWIEQALQLGEKYGVSLVLLVFLVIAGVIVAKWMFTKFDQILAIALALKSNIPDPKQENVEHLVVLNSKIKDCLRDIMIELGADWCQLWQFHDGVHGVGKARIPFMFLAITHEVCKDDSAKMMTEFNQLPLSLFDESVKSMMLQDVLIYKSNIDSPTSMGKLITDLGGRTAFMRTIRDEENQVVAFVSVIWKDNNIVSNGNRLKFVNATQRMAAILASVGQ